MDLAPPDFVSNISTPPNLSNGKETDLAAFKLADRCNVFNKRPAAVLFRSTMGAISMWSLLTPEHETNHQLQLVFNYWLTKLHRQFPFKLLHHGDCVEMTDWRQWTFNRSFRPGAC